MNRDEAFAMLKAMIKFQKVDLKVTDFDVECGRVEFQFSGGDKAWFNLWEAAKVIEALS